ncbi:MAG: hypothetical protein ACPGXL_10630, partial [Chitinophagales bacterium]
MNRSNLSLASAYGIAFLGYVALMYFTPRQNFYQVLGLFTLLFATYGWIYRQTSSLKHYQIGIFVAVIVRLVLVFALPNLSDDFYRFMWDGRLLVNEVSPFAYLPSQFFDGTYTGEPIVGINETLLHQLNSPNYFTIYPPVCQLVFYVACYLFPNDLYSATVVMKSFLFAFECGSIYVIHHLVKRFGLEAKKVLLYALNPLVIIELTGNLHFEGAMICF